MRAIYQNLLFTWHNSHSKLIFGVSKSPQCKQGLQEKQARIHSLTQENHKSECFCMKWKKKKKAQIYCFHQFFSIQEIYLVSVHHIITALFTEMPGLKTPQAAWSGQMGKAFMMFPEWLFSCHAWKKHRCIWPFIIFLFPVSTLHWTRHSSASGLKEWQKWRLHLWLQRSEDQGSGSRANYLWTREWYLFSIHTPCRAANITLVHPM